MVKKLLPWMRVLIIVASLVLGQVQMVVTHAAPQNNENASTTADSRVVTDTSSTEPGEPPADAGEVARQISEPGCSMRVSGFAVKTDPPASPDWSPVYWGGTQSDAFYKHPEPWLTYLDLNPYRNTVSDANGAKVGQTVRVFVGVGNSSQAVCGTALTLTNVTVTAELRVVLPSSYGNYDKNGTIIYTVPTQPSVFTWTGTAGTLNVNQTATMLFNYVLPPDLKGDVHVHVSATANWSDGTNSGTDTDADDSFVKVVGPGFSVLSFDSYTDSTYTNPNKLAAAPGETVYYRLSIMASREGTEINSISLVTAPDGDSLDQAFVNSCNGIGNWTNPDGSALAPPIVFNQEAVCDFSITVPQSPPPDNVILTGDLTVSDTAGNGMNARVNSDNLPVTLPKVGVTKQVYMIERPGVFTWTLGSGPMPSAAPGDRIVYRVTITNIGLVNLTVNTVFDTLTGMVPFVPNMSIPVGESRELMTTPYVVKPGGADPLINSVEVKVTGQGTTIQTSAQAAASLDIVDSALLVRLTALNNATGLPFVEAEAERTDTVRYRLEILNNGSTLLRNFQLVEPARLFGITSADLQSALASIPAQPPSPAYLLVREWTYPISADTPDPLLSSVRVRATDDSTSTLVYGTSSVELNITNPGIEIFATVVEPEAPAGGTPTVLRGGNVVYNVAVENKGASALCNVVVDQYLSTPANPNGTLVKAGIALDFSGQPGPGQIAGGNTVSGLVTYQVLGDTLDPLNMIFDVRAVDCATSLVEFTDRTLRSVDVSDVQINAQILPTFNGDGTVTLTYRAVNASAVELRNLLATYCITRHSDTLCDQPFAVTPSNLPGSFSVATGSFVYTIQAGDELLRPFNILVTLTGTDNRNNEVSIKTILDLPIASDKLPLTLVGPTRGVVGDTVNFAYRVRNLTGTTLNNVTLCNLVADPSCASPIPLTGPAPLSTVMLDNELLEGTVPEVIVDNGDDPDDQIMTMAIRVEATQADAPFDVFTSNATWDVEIIPLIDVAKVVSAGTGIPGEPLTFTITITNQSITQTLTLTDVEDTLLESAPYNMAVTLDHFQPNPIAPGGSVSHSYDIASVAAVPNPLVNTFRAYGFGSTPDPLEGFDTVSVELQCPIDVIVLPVNQDAPNVDWSIGEMVDWRVTLRNDSGRTLYNITANHTLAGIAEKPQPLTSAIPSLANGAFYEYSIEDILIDGRYFNPEGWMRDAVTIAFTDEGGSPVQCKPQEFEQIVVPPVQILKTADRYMAVTGETITYEFTLFNVNEDDDGLYASFYVSSVTDPHLVDNPVISCDFGSGLEPTGLMLPGSSADNSPNIVTCESREFVVPPTDAETLDNQAWVEFDDPADPGHSFRTWDELKILVGSPLIVTKTASVPEGQQAKVGDAITYDYTIFNSSRYLITGITLQDSRLPQGSAGSPLDFGGGVFSIDLPSGTSRVLSDVPYTIMATDPDPLINVVTVRGTVNPDEEGRAPWTFSMEVAETVDLVDSELAVVLTARDNAGVLLPDELPASLPGGDGMPEAPSGTPIQYCFEVTNRNTSSVAFVDNIEISDQRILDPVALGQLFEAANTANPTQPRRLYGGQTVSFCAPQDGSGNPLYITLNTSMGDPIVNTAVVEGDSSGEGTPRMRGESTLAIDLQGTDLLVSKVPSRIVAFTGETIEYTVTVTNKNVGSSIHGIKVTDALGAALPQTLQPGDFAWVGGGYDPGTGDAWLDAGGYATYTYSYEVKPNDPVSLINTLRATGVLLGNTGDADPNNDEDRPVEDSTRAAVTISASQLLVEKTAMTPSALPGTTVNYVVSITNIGQTTVKDLFVVDEHYGAEIICPDAGALVPTCGRNIGPYQTISFTYQLTMPTAPELVTAPEKDPYLNEVRVYGVVYDLATGNQIPNPEPGEDKYLNGVEASYSIRSTDTAVVDIINPNIRVTKVPKALASTPGVPVDYTITITNIGQEPLTGITVDDLETTGPGFEPDYNLDDPSVCPNVSLAVCPFVYGTMLWDHDANPATPAIQSPRAGQPYNPAPFDNGTYQMPGGLIANERLIGIISVAMPPNYTGTQFTNVVAVTANGGTIMDRSSATIDVREASITVSKTPDTLLSALGAPVNYTLTVTNVGGLSFNRLIITDKGIDPLDLDGDGNSSTLILDSTTLPLTPVGGFPNTAEGGPNTFDRNEVFVFPYRYTIIGTDSDPYVNTARVDAIDTVSGAKTVAVASATVDVEAADIRVEKFVCANLASVPANGQPPTDPAECVQAVNTNDATTPDVLTYFLHVYNPGLVPLEDISIQDTLVPTSTFDSIVWPVAASNGLAASDGAPGGDDELWFHYTYTVQPGDLDPLRNVVTVTGFTPPPEGTTERVQVQDGAMAEVALVTGDLLITKTANPASATVGSSVQYSYTVTNLSASDEITNIEVYDPLVSPANAQVSCPDTTLAAGASMDCGPISYVVGPLDPRPFVNTATVRGLQNGVTVSDAGTHTLQILTTGLSVTKLANVQVASVGQIVTYIYEITNTGTAPIAGLSVLDSDTAVMNDPAWDWPNYLPVNGRETVVIQREIKATDPDPYTNTVRVTGLVLATGVPGGIRVATEATESVAIANGALVVENAPSAPYATSGDTVTFSYTLRNLGDEELTITGATDDLCTASDPNALMNQIPTDPADPNRHILAQGTSLTIFCTIPVTPQMVAAGTPIFSLLRVDGVGAESGNPVSDTASAQVEITSGGVLVQKTADRTTAQSGDVITYTITVTNVGGVPLSGISFNDPTINNPLPVPPSTLAVRGSFTVTGTYTVQPGDQVITNTASVTATCGAGTCSDSASVSVYVIDDPDAELLVTKTTTTTEAQPGASITYTLRVQNVSTGVIDDIELVDNGNVVATIPSLGPSGVFQTTVTLNVPADYTQAQFVNEAWAWPVGETDRANEYDSATVTLPVTLVTIQKTADPTSVVPGEQVTYTYVVTNLSTAELTSVVLVDSMQSVPALSSGFAWTTPLGTVPAAGAGTATAVATLTLPVGYASGTIQNTVEAQIGGLPVGEGGPTSVTVIAPSPALEIMSIVASPNPPPLNFPTAMTYTITYRNIGNVALNGLAGTYSLTGSVTASNVALPALTSPLARGAAPVSVDVVRTDTFTGPYTFATTITFTNPGGSPATASLAITPEEYSDVLTGQILSVTQGVEAGGPVVNGVVTDPLQTGETMTVTGRLTNTGTEPVTVNQPTLAINVTGTPPAVPSCTFVPGATVWPVALPGSGTVDVSFSCTVPAGLAEYRTTNGLTRIFTLSALSSTGLARADLQTEALPTAQITLVDLVLDVQLRIINSTTSAEVTQVTPNVPVTFEITLANQGASRLGCDTTEAPPTPVTIPATPPPACRLALTGEVLVGTPTGITDPVSTALFNNLLQNAVRTGTVPSVGGTVLGPMGSPTATATFTTATFTYTGTGTLRFGVRATGGYYQNGLAQALLNEFTTFDVVDRTLVVGIVPLTLTINVSPNPSIFGQTVSYVVTANNPANGSAVTGLRGTYTIVGSTTLAVPEDGIVLASNARQTVLTGTLTFDNSTPLQPGESRVASTISRTETFTTSYIFSASIQVDGMPATEFITANRTVTPQVVAATPTPQGGVSTGDPVIEKTASAETAQPGDVLTWTIIVRNDTTGTMEGVVMQDSLPGGLEISSAATSIGTIAREGQLVTLTLPSLAPASAATVTVSTTVGEEMTSPAEIVNTACALRTGGSQVCATATVSLGPSVEDLPLTGQSLIATGGGLASTVLFVLTLLSMLGLMMASQTSDRRAIIAAAILVVVLAALVVVVAMALLGGDEEGKPTEEAGLPETTGPVVPAPLPTESGPSVLFQFPPTPTPYVVPTPAGIRYLMIPKLGEQFSVPIPIVRLPIVNEEWDVSGLGQYVGWLEGTTWLDNQWGNTVLAAHVQLGTDNPGPFWGLSQLVPGDEIRVLEGGSERVYVVASTRKVDPSDWSVTAPTNTPVLTLITCAEWSAEGGVFAQRMVVQAVPAVHGTISS